VAARRPAHPRRAGRPSRRRAAERGGPRRAARGSAITGRLAYLDTSAFVKLPLREPEHDALRAELTRWDGYLSSALLRVEAVRTCARYGSEYAAQASAGLAAIALLPIDDAVLDAAAALEPVALRSLAAIHLATALSAGDDLGMLVAYDRRLCDAAVRLGLPVTSPEAAG
jgi:predicted nucleic acid-binding protein